MARILRKSWLTLSASSERNRDEFAQDPPSGAVHIGVRPCAGAAEVRESGPYRQPGRDDRRSEEHTSELQSLMRISYAVFCLKKKKTIHPKTKQTIRHKTQTIIQ